MHFLTPHQTRRLAAVAAHLVAAAKAALAAQAQGLVQDIAVRALSVGVGRTGEFVALVLTPQRADDLFAPDTVASVRGALNGVRLLNVQLSSLSSATPSELTCVFDLVLNDPMGESRDFGPSLANAIRARFTVEGTKEVNDEICCALQDAGVRVEETQFAFTLSVAELTIVLRGDAPRQSRAAAAVRAVLAPRFEGFVETTVDARRRHVVVTLVNTAFPLSSRHCLPGTVLTDGRRQYRFLSGFGVDPTYPCVMENMAARCLAFFRDTSAFEPV
jgi:hypothetical protein